MENNKATIEFDENAARRLQSAVRETLRNTPWNVLDNDDWAKLQALQDIQTRLAAFLGGT